MKTLFVGNIDIHLTEDELSDLFSQYGIVRKIELPRDLFSGKNKGFAFVSMEGHEARLAMAELDGKTHLNKPLKVREEKAKPKGRGGRRR